MRWMALAAVVVAAAPAAMAADNQTTASVRLYSNYCLHDETGDVLGARITLMRFYDGDYVAFQLAEGEFHIPSLVKASIDDKSGAILFEVADQSYQLGFRGTLTPKTLRGRITWRESPSSTEDITLHRVLNGREPVKSCGHQ